MAFDAGMMTAVVHELNTVLAGAKLEKISQPEKDELQFVVRAGGEIRRVLLSASSSSPRICFTTQPKESPKVPPMFCTLLRKHLIGAKFLGVSQPGFERVAEISFDAKDEMGFPVERKLVCEVMGKFSNLIFTDGEGKILAALRPVDFTTSEKRQVLPGMRYELPPAQQKDDPLTETREDFLRKMADGGLSRVADKAIVATYLGLAPCTAREMVCRAGGKAGALLEELSGDALWEAFSFVTAILREKRFEPCLVLEGDRAVEYGFLPLTQYEMQGFTLRRCTASEAICGYFAVRTAGETLRQKAQDILKVLNAAESRLQRKIAAQEEELAACAEKEKLREAADLITANLYALKRGDEQVTLINYYSPDMEEVTLTLDRRLTPTANAQRYYKKYTKLKNAEVALTEQLRIAREELAYLQTVYESLGKSEGQRDLDEIRRELVASGLVRAKRLQLPKQQRPREPMTFRTRGGFTVLCGRNNAQNDELSFRIAEKGDWWFHVKNAPGSHVVLCCGGVDDPPAEDFTDAAIIAATYSSLSDGETVTVDYTKVKNLKKPPAAKPGYVIYHQNYAAYVRPDKQKCDAMRVDKDKIL